MQYKQLGRTGLYVSRLCLGAMTFGTSDVAPWNAVGVLDQKGAGKLVDQALDAGINFFDTANVYSRGQSEIILGKALAKHRDDVVIATKATGSMGDGPNQQGQSRPHLLHEVEASLKRLGTDHIDLYQVHAWDPITPIEEVLTTLDDLVRSGKVRYIGCSNYAAWQMATALGVSATRGLESFVSTQSFYSLVGRDLEDEIIPLAEHSGLGVLVWSPLAGGFLSGKFTRDGESSESGARRASFDFPPVDKDQGYDIVDSLKEIADSIGATVPQVALAWLLAKPAVTSVIVGAKREDQLADNLGAVDLELTSAQVERLDDVSAISSRYPGWMLARQAEQRDPNAA
ncbi:MAG: aldo/keto reductase [Solirubrobacteraceae bacterium]|nr:aldo/keto reductase [Solirubrobacteraceae bacterium]